ncbi:hypothetical protein [Methylocella sp.]|uniref:hypothetical protein n=1 Tax=Methylocella sp. TaxID=1978226 RepID=UPI0037848083
MTVAQLIEQLASLPGEAVVLMDSGGGLSLVAALDFVDASGPGAPAEVILIPNMEE